MEVKMVAIRKWEVVKIAYCERAGEDVALEADVVYPASFLPEQPPRIITHRCSRGLVCNSFRQPGCCWSGTNPDYDPFKEPSAKKDG
jgi:hypothetical protein